MLAAYFIAEGAAEGVAGDVAFIQSIVETGWFRFGGVVPPSANNFAGLGATGTNSLPAAFPDAHTGVRAQIQHLRAYADPSAVTCTMPPLHHPCVDPRFGLVLPKGRARTWNQMGNGNWAASADYASDDPLAIRGSEGVHDYYQRRHSGEYWRSRIRSSTLRLSMKTVKTWINPMKA